jgi:hypothetical protein
MGPGRDTRTGLLYRGVRSREAIIIIRLTGGRHDLVKNS